MNLSLCTCDRCTGALEHVRSLSIADGDFIEIYREEHHTPVGHQVLLRMLPAATQAFVTVYRAGRVSMMAILYVNACLRVLVRVDDGGLAAAIKEAVSLPYYDLVQPDPVVGGIGMALGKFAEAWAEPGDARDDTMASLINEHMRAPIMAGWEIGTHRQEDGTIAYARPPRGVSFGTEAEADAFMAAAMLDLGGRRGGDA